MEAKEHSYLRRLDPAAYQGYAIVHWTHSIRDRKRGWLTDSFHARFRECLIHAGGLFSLWTPAYCLMPDHFHIVWMGVSERTDLRKANSWFRRQLNLILRMQGFELQKQAYDRVFREREKDRFSFERLVGYVFENPTRAGLIEEASAPSDWEYRDSILHGYPELSWQSGARDYWHRFWRVYNTRMERGE